LAAAASGQAMPGGNAYFGIGIAAALVGGALTLFVMWWRRRRRNGGKRMLKQCKAPARQQPKIFAKAALIDNPLRKKREGGKGRR
jgi:hypothetical protein